MAIITRHRGDSKKKRQTMHQKQMVQAVEEESRKMSSKRSFQAPSLITSMNRSRSRTRIGVELQPHATRDDP